MYALLALHSLLQLISIYNWLRVATTVMTVLAAWQLRRKKPDMAAPVRNPRRTHRPNLFGRRSADHERSSPAWQRPLRLDLGSSGAGSGAGGVFRAARERYTNLGPATSDVITQNT